MLLNEIQLVPSWVDRLGRTVKWGSPHGRRFITTLAVNSGSFALSTVTAIIAARMLSPTGRGQLAGIQNVAMASATLFGFGIPSAIAYFSAKSAETRSSTFASGLVALFPLGLAGAVAAWFAVPLLLRGAGPETILAGRCFVVMVPAQLIGAIPYYLLYGSPHYVLWNLLRLLQPALWLLALLTLGALGVHSGPGAAYAYMIAMGLQYAAWFPTALRVLPGKFRVDSRLIRKFFRYGLPSVLAGVSQQLNYKLDQLLIAATLPPQSLGLYVVAVAWSTLPGPVMAAISPVVFPKIAQCTDRTAQSRIFWSTTRFTLLLGALLSLCVAASAPYLLPRIFGEDYRASVSPAVILSVASALNHANNTLGEACRGMGQPGTAMCAEFAGLVATVVGLIVLLPRYGISGAAIASGIAYLCTFLLFMYLSRRRRSLCTSC